MILSEVIWFNSSNKIDISLCIFLFFCDKYLKFVGQLFNDNGNIKPWKEIKIELYLKNTHKNKLVTNY